MIRKHKSVLLGIIAILAVAYPLYWFIASLSKQSDVLKTAIIAACATVLGSVLTVTFTQIKERRMTIERDQQERRIPIYGQFLASFSETVANPEKTGKNTVFGPFPPEMLVWASDDVIRAWARIGHLRNESLSDKTIGNTMVAFGDMLLAMRRDLGYANENISKEDILATFARPPSVVVNKNSPSQSIP